MLKFCFSKAGDIDDDSLFIIVEGQVDLVSKLGEKSSRIAVWETFKVNFILNLQKKKNKKQII